MDRSHRWWSTPFWNLARSEFSNLEPGQVIVLQSGPWPGRSTPILNLARSEVDDFDLRHFEQVRTRELAPLETGRWELVI